MSTANHLKKVLDEMPSADTRTDHYARTYPDLPERLGDIVRWLDTNLRTAGYGFMIERIDRQVVEIQSSWCSTYSLTPAEMRLAAHLVQGGTIASYAKRQGLSRHTARNQLQSAYCKTGTHRQAELVALLLKA